MEKIHTLRGVILLALVISIASCAPQSLTMSQNDKIDILERRVVALEQEKLKALSDLRDEVSGFKKKVSSEIDNFRKSQRFFIEELNRLKQDQQLITGDTETSRLKIRKNSIKLKKLNKRVGNLSISLQELRKFFNSNLNTIESSTDQQRSDFKHAFDLFKKRRFKKSREAFSKFRRKYSTSPLVDDSIYLMAYMYFLQGDYGRASSRFLELINQYPSTNRLNDAKWWLGVSLERSGDLNGALDIYRELTRLDKRDPIRRKAEFRLEELSPEDSLKQTKGK